ncbi:unnamed protein product [Musa acuminata subsp. malaccensis]|uniref:(wild Malaysian banana) hypothetical protein n=1 Tax=Musa acuminata subsp. malaccensis TaxID=214687 RepID=A0A8D7A6T3_MUSAM|nr:unnamed protein product [Musa acuminata subsp. malaccensis]
MSGGHVIDPSAAGTSRPLTPKLHQATQAPLQATQTTPWQASSSWQPEISAIEFAKKFEQHSVQGEASSSQIMQPVVSIMPEVTSHSVNHAVMQKLVKLHRESYLGGCLLVYDGRKSHYTAGPLPFTSKEFQITLNDEDDGSSMEMFSTRPTEMPFCNFIIYFCCKMAIS